MTAPVSNTIPVPIEAEEPAAERATDHLSFCLRASNGSDALSCARIVCEWGRKTPWAPAIDDPETVAESWRPLLEAETAWVGERDGSVIGFCVREDDNITGLYVQSDARRLGMGKALLDLAKQDRDWITVWVYEKNTRARAFYRREGLEEIGREKDEYSPLIYIENRWRRA
jgi:ribosomal protein S18 acetylase RimI-like enzyme